MNELPREKHNLAVRLFWTVSDPQIEKRLKFVAKGTNPQSLRPVLGIRSSRKELRNLARRLQTIGRDLDRFRGASKLAEDCRSRAKYINMALAMSPISTKLPRTMTYKAFWKHLPLAMLCQALDVPRAISFVEIEELLRCAYSAHGRNVPIPQRRVEREYKGFMQLLQNLARKSSDPLLLQGFVDACLAIALATK